MCYRCLSYGAAALFPLQYTPDWVTYIYLTVELFLFCYVMLCYVKDNHAHWEGSHADAFHEQTLCAENIE